MLELVTNNYVVVEKEFSNLREALTEAKGMLDSMAWVEFVWIRKKNGILMLGRMTRERMYWSEHTSLPTELV
jgi:hypothetical protein